METSKFWMQSGILFIYGRALDTQSHKHNAVQIIWPAADCELFIENKIKNQAVIIANDIEHRLHMQQGWVVLVEPQSVIGEQLKLSLGKKPFQIIENLDNYQNTKINQSENPAKLLNPLFKLLRIDDLPLFTESINTHTDLRIQKLQSQLDQCFKQDCMKPEKWLASEVANHLALSESRFLHLFKQEMKIPWRPYLLWRRLLCAINAMHKGSSATHAAYQAGFADSAHLSRTFRSMFGISIRQAQSKFNNTK